MSESKYGGGFLVRMVILLVVLGLVVVLYFQDSKMTKEANAKLDQAMNLINKETEDGGGIPKDMVSKELGIEPSKTENDGKYEIDTYTFGRAMPFAPKIYITAVFENGGLVQMIPNAPYDKEKVKDKFIPKPEKIDPSRLPQAAVAGPPAPSNDDDDEKDDEKDRPADDAAEEKSDDAAEEKSDDAAEEKSDDAAEEKSDENTEEKGDG